VPELAKLGIGFVDIDIKSKDGRKLARDNKVSGMPSYDICYKSTRKKLHTGHIVGYRDVASFVKLIDRYLAKVVPRKVITQIAGVELPDILEDAIDHPDTIWTDRNKHPALHHTPHNTYLVGYNPAAEKGPNLTGSPNNEIGKWKNSGGCDAFASELSGRTCFYYPSKVDAWEEIDKVPGFRNDKLIGTVKHWVGNYPVGTVGGEFIETDILHAIRYRTKTDEGWYGEQIDVNPMPAGYVPVANCVDCHRQITDHANDIDNDQEWYTHIRGFEKDGFFNSPFMVMTGTGEGTGGNKFRWDNTHLLNVIE